MRALHTVHPDTGNAVLGTAPTYRAREGRGAWDAGGTETPRPALPWMSERPPFGKAEAVDPDIMPCSLASGKKALWSSPLLGEI